MNGWIGSLVVAAPVCVLAYVGHKRINTRRFSVLFAEAVFIIVCLNLFTSSVDAVETVVGRVTKWRHLDEVTCVHMALLDDVVQGRCDVANKGLKRSWFSLYISAMGEIGWIVAMFRVDVVGAFFVISDSHVGTWATAMTLVAICAAALVAVAVSAGPRWCGKSRPRRAKPRAVPPAELHCTPDPTHPSKLVCVPAAPTRIMFTKNYAGGDDNTSLPPPPPPFPGLPVTPAVVTIDGPGYDNGDVYSDATQSDYSDH